MNIETGSNKEKTANILYVAVFLLSAVPALFLSAPFVEDALGTMGAAAYLTGHDWGDFLVDKGFYYKYGEAVLYLPVFLLIREPAIRYKILLVINSLVTAFIPVIIYRISRKHLGISKDDAACASLICGCMPATMLYSKLTWAEPVLFLIPWVILYLFMELEETGQRLSDVHQHGSEEKKLRIYRRIPVDRVIDKDLTAGDVLNNNDLVRRQKMLSALLAWACVYTFMSHQRGIVVVLGTVLFIILWAVKNKELLVSPFIFMTNLVAALAMDRVLDAWLKIDVYKGAELKHNLLSAFLHIDIYKKMFSLRGFQVLLKSVVGWLFNSSVSGLGISLLGILISFSVIFGYKKIRNYFSAKFRIICILGAILYVGAFSLGILSFFETAYDYWQGTEISRCDHLVFGRYLESTLPVMLFVGVYTFIDSCDQKQYHERDFIQMSRRLSGISMLLLIIMTTFFIIVISPAMAGIDSYVHSLMSMNICFDMTSVTETKDVISNLPQAITVFGVFTCLFYLACNFLVRRGKIKVVYVMMGCLFLYIYMRNCQDVLYRVDYYSLTDYAQFYLTH